MGREPLDPAQLIPLLDSLVDLAAELEAATEAEAMQEKEPKRVQAR
jgi:hypothetical protein